MCAKCTLQIKDLSSVPQSRKIKAGRNWQWKVLPKHCVQKPSTRKKWVNVQQNTPTSILWIISKYLKPKSLVLRNPCVADHNMIMIIVKRCINAYTLNLCSKYAKYLLSFLHTLMHAFTHQKVNIKQYVGRIYAHLICWLY